MFKLFYCFSTSYVYYVYYSNLLTGSSVTKQVMFYILNLTNARLRTNSSRISVSITVSISPSNCAIKLLNTQAILIICKVVRLIHRPCHSRDIIDDSIWFDPIPTCLLTRNCCVAINERRHIGCAIVRNKHTKHIICLRFRIETSEI